MKLLTRIKNISLLIVFQIAIIPIVSCEEVEQVIIKSDGVFLPSGNILQIGNSESQIEFSLGKSYTTDENPNGKVLIYNDLRIDVSFNKFNKVNLIGFYFYMKDASGNKLSPCFRNFMIFDVKIHYLDSFDQVLTKIKQSKIQYTIEEKTSFKKVVLHLNKNYFISLRFSKEHNYKISALQYYSIE